MEHLAKLKQRLIAESSESPLIHYQYDVFQNADTIETEMSMLLTLTSMLLFVSYIPLSSIDREEIEYAIEEDEGSDFFYIAIAIIMWPGVLLSATSCFYALLIYYCWRSRRPHPGNKEFPLLFYASFKTELQIVYWTMILDCWVLAFSSIVLAYVKTGTKDGTIYQNVESALGVITLLAWCYGCYMNYTKRKQWSAVCDEVRFSKVGSIEQQYEL